MKYIIKFASQLNSQDLFNVVKPDIAIWHIKRVVKSNRFSTIRGLDEVFSREFGQKRPQGEALLTKLNTRLKKGRIFLINNQPSRYDTPLVFWKTSFDKTLSWQLVVYTHNGVFAGAVTNQVTRMYSGQIYTRKSSHNNVGMTPTLFGHLPYAIQRSFLVETSKIKQGQQKNRTIGQDLVSATDGHQLFNPKKLDAAKQKVVVEIQPTGSDIDFIRSNPNLVLPVAKKMHEEAGVNISADLTTNSLNQALLTGDMDAVAEHFARLGELIEQAANRKFGHRTLGDTSESDSDLESGEDRRSLGGGRPPPKSEPKTEKSAEKNSASEETDKSSEEDDVEPKLVSIEILDGDDDTIVTGTADQWVNLPKDNKYIDGKRIKNSDRLSKYVRLKAKFNKAGSFKFKVKAVADAKNIKYSDNEKGKNDNFKYLEEELSFTTGGDGTKIIEKDFYLDVAGGNTYSFEASDDKDNKAKSSGKVKTNRKLYYQEVVMEGNVEKTAAASLATFTGEFSKQKIELDGFDRVAIPTMENIGSKSDSNKFLSAVKKAFNSSEGAKRSPYCVSVAYTDHLAVKNPKKDIVLPNVKADENAKAVSIMIAGEGLMDSQIRPRALWKNLVTGEGWFVNATFTDDEGKSHDISEDKVTPVPLNSSTPDLCMEVKVDVSNFTSEKGTITLTVNWVDRMRAGLSFGGTNVICVCTKAWWRAKGASSQNDTIIHEMGHQVGLTANGEGSGLDKIDSHYDNAKGHVGNHCYYGNADGLARYNTQDVAKKAKCVMYGQTVGVSAFCPNCSTSAVKQDVTDGW